MMQYMPNYYNSNIKIMSDCQETNESEEATESACETREDQLISNEIQD